MINDNLWVRFCKREVDSSSPILSPYEFLLRKLTLYLRLTRMWARLLHCFPSLNDKKWRETFHFLTIQHEMKRITKQNYKITFSFIFHSKNLPLFRLDSLFLTKSTSNTNEKIRNTIELEIMIAWKDPSRSVFPGFLVLE